jgi:hypothetical protein
MPPPRLEYPRLLDARVLALLPIPLKASECEEPPDDRFCVDP